MFNVYDKVWVLYNNRPIKMTVFAVIDSMNYWKTGTERLYRLAGSRIGAGWGNNEGCQYKEENVFKTKEDLLKSL